MALSCRFPAVVLACCLISRSAFANDVQADAAIVDDGQDAAAGQPDSGKTAADAAAADDSDGAATSTNGQATAADGSAAVVQIPSATGEQYSAPNFEGDDGCASTGASSGSFSTIAVGLFAMLALAWSRRTRNPG